MSRRDTVRTAALDRLVDTVALEDFADHHGKPELPPVAVVIASYKEQDNVGGVVESIPTEICGLGAATIVVVDGEEDGTAEIVRGLGQYAAVAPVNRGQGAALRLGYEIARTHGATYIVTADADGQTAPGDLAVVLEPVVAGEADFSNGSRRLGETHSSDTVRQTGVVFFSRLITALTGTKVTDPANPIRAMHAAFTEELVLEESQYQASELLIAALSRGARFAERPVTMRLRRSGHSKKGSNLVYGYRYAVVVVRTWRRERPRRAGTRPVSAAR